MNLYGLLFISSSELGIRSGEDQPGARNKHLTKVNRHDLRLFSNKSIKSIANYKNRSKSIITRKRAIDIYRFPILFDWLLSITIDYDRFLSSIENID